VIERLIHSVTHIFWFLFIYREKLRNRTEKDTKLAEEVMVPKTSSFLPVFFGRNQCNQQNKRENTTSTWTSLTYFYWNTNVQYQYTCMSINKWSTLPYNIEGWLHSFSHKCVIFSCFGCCTSEWECDCSQSADLLSTREIRNPQVPQSRCAN